MKSMQTKDIGNKVYYSNLLQRYARRLIQDEAEAARLVKKVLDDEHIPDDMAPCKRLRNILKTDLLNHCNYWKQSQIFDQPPVYLPKYNQQFSKVENNDHKSIT